MRTLLIALLTLSSTIIFAQQTVTWEGGTPGNETSWNEARNWSNNNVPDENSYVIIKHINSGHNAQPVINSDVSVASIELQAGSNLTVEESGELLIDGEYNYTEGISFYGGELINKGVLAFYSLAIDISDEDLSSIQNTGSVFVDNKLRGCTKNQMDSKVQFVIGN